MSLWASLAKVASKEYRTSGLKEIVISCCGNGERREGRGRRRREGGREGEEEKGGMEGRE